MNELKHVTDREEFKRAYELKGTLVSTDMKHTLESEIV